MLNIVIFGAPGSGKGTQGQKIAGRYGLHHISTGQVLRDHISRGTELGKIADSYISKGNLIPDELMVRVLDHTLDKLEKEEAKGVIFDGFPRTVPQAEELQKLLEKRGTSLHGVVGLEVPEGELMTRMVERGKVSGRADDNPETIRQRLKVYHDQTEPLRQYYIGRKVYVPIDGSGDIDTIFGGICRKLDSLKGK